MSAGGSSWRWVVFATALLPALLAAACTNQDAVLGVVTPPPSGTPISLSKNVQPILTSQCATSGCHGTPLFAPMTLEASAAHAALVGMPSCEAPGVKRVEPFSSSTSYLISKLEGTQSAVLQASGCASCDYGSGPVFNVRDCGMQMPQFGPFLDSTAIQLIRGWIDQGAQDN